MRVIESSDRVRMVRRVGLATVGVAAIADAPAYGWRVLVLPLLGALNFWGLERRLHRSDRPELVSARGVLVTLLLLGYGVAITGGPTSPALPWMILPAAMIATRFRRQVVIAGFALTVVSILFVTAGLRPAATAHHPELLLSTLALLAGVVSVVWALQAAELHHRDEATIDPLTGLLNRYALVPRFVEIAHQARRTGASVCLILCDVDSFKSVNDRHGHDRGDAVLRDIADQIRKQLRAFELVYRFGGEEFLVVLPGVDLHGGVRVAERLRACVERADPTGIPVTISIGVSAAEGEAVEYDRLFKLADNALYEAKQGGRNRAIRAAGDAVALGEVPMLAPVAG